jgi:hypothetical protein
MENIHLNKQQHKYLFDLLTNSKIFFCKYYYFASKKLDSIQCIDYLQFQYNADKRHGIISRYLILHYSYHNNYWDRGRRINLLSINNSLRNTKYINYLLFLYNVGKSHDIINKYLYFHY